MTEERPPGPLAVPTYAPVTPGSPQMEANPLASGGAPVFDVVQVQVPPMPTYQARPQYPVALRRRGISGVATTDFIVDEFGITRNVTCASATDPRFAAAAVDAVARWRFRPGLIGGRQVRVHMQVPIVFSLNNED